jgi:L-alanine-DL-glutamate epimerase-like enolase superfamily enzyme
MVDANQALTLEKAVRLARRLEDCHVDWFEEPFSRHDIESYVQLARRTEIPLAAGEREFGTQGFRRLVDARAISVVQPDLLRVGGVTGWQLVAGLAKVNLLGLAPHFYREYDLHLAASQPHTVAIESFDWLDFLLQDPFEVHDGLAHIPDRPGFGVIFKPEAIREYRHQPSGVDSR